MTEKAPYETPHIEKVGSLADLTQASRYSATGDGGVFHPTANSTVLLTTSRPQP